MLRERASVYEKKLYTIQKQTNWFLELARITYDEHASNGNALLCEVKTKSFAVLR